MGFCLLPERGLLLASGKDAAPFLHRLASASVSDLPVGAAAFTALLSAQGKLLYDFFIYRQEEERLILDVHQSCLAPLQEKLAFYRLGARVEIEALPWRVGVVFGASAEEEKDHIKAPILFQDPRFSQLGWRFWLPYEESAPQETTSPERWAFHRLRLGVGEVGSDFAPDSVYPLHANMDLLGAIRTEKGCYVGQEVVARMVRKGALRKRYMPCQLADGLKLVEVTIPPWLSLPEGTQE